MYRLVPRHQLKRPLGGLLRGKAKQLLVQHYAHAEFFGGIKQHLRVVRLGNANHRIVEGIFAHHLRNLQKGRARGWSVCLAQVKVRIKVHNLHVPQRLVSAAVGGK